MTKPYPTLQEIMARIDKPTADWTLREVIVTACDIDRERREVAPAESIPWAEHPWARWAAKDRNGECWLYSDKPEHYKAYPSAKEDCKWVGSGIQTRFYHDGIPGPWDNSLRSRPEGV